ncbi:hypothetical protein [Pseudomonas oryzihabitans]|uniref:hypothetical protein n=1 Tax=Pseudomonas oryzihabitans TaxID=47885 RepID=UPI00241FC9B1|nr:hypothetical protein [Pseudomonas oryzihabitans]
MKKGTFLAVALSVIPFIASATDKSALVQLSTCDSHSLSFLQNSRFATLIPHEGEGARLQLQDGKQQGDTTRWLFAKPLVENGIALKGFYQSRMELAGSEFINWGFYSDQGVEEIAQMLGRQKVGPLTLAGDVYARPESWTPELKTWVLEDPSDTSGKLVTQGAERVLLIEPLDPGEGLPAKSMVSCSLQGKLTKDILASSRPDLAPR